MGIQVIESTKTVSPKGDYSTIMYEIQRRIVDIETNREQKRPIDNEVAEMVVLTTFLSKSQNIDPSLIKDRKPIIDKLFK